VQRSRCQFWRGVQRSRYQFLDEVVAVPTVTAAAGGEDCRPVVSKSALMTTTRQWGSVATVAALAAAAWGIGAVGQDQAHADVVVQLPGAITSPNIEYVGTIPVESPGVSHAVREVDGQRRLFVSGIKGLSIYDADDPAAPSLLGFLPLPHSQNEDVQVSADGTRAIIAADGGLPAPNQATRGLHVIDTTDPANPVWQAWLDNAAGGTNHTATCADDACEWVYGNRGSIYHVPADAASAEDVEVVGSWFREGITSSHALNRSVHPDPVTGEPVTIMISDSEPRLVLDATDPANPVVLATSDPADHEGDGLLQHNNTRPNAALWRPRSAVADEPTAPTRKGPSQLPARAADRARQAAGVDGTSDPATPTTDPFGGHLRPGELVIGNSESNVVPQCDDESGGLTTFSIADFDQGAPMEPLHTFRPVNGSWQDGNPAVNGLGCSGHWFDIRDGDTLIAASWYEHGVKVIEVQPDYSMREVGFFQPVVTAAGAATWVVDDDGTEYIYSTDYARGLDILRFHRDAPEATPADTAAAAALVLRAAQPQAELERMFCRLGAA